MKKLLIVLCAAVLLCSCSQNNVKNSETVNSESTDEAADTSSEAADVLPADESAIPDGFSVDFENAYYTTSGGTNYILIEASFTNESDATMAFNEVYSLQAFQNGVGLTHTNNWDAGKYDMTAYAAPLKSNYSTKVYIGFEARSESEGVDLECTPIGGGNVISQTLNLSTIVVESTTTTTTQAVVQTPVIIQPPAPSTPSTSYSSTGYTCQGRTMEQAAALMTASEKAIVNNPSSSREQVNAQYAKHGYCFTKSYWHTYFYGYDH